MKVYPMIAALALLAFVSCSSRRDITMSPGSRTDYIVGKAYKLKQPVYLQGGALGRFHDKALEERYRAAKPSWITGIIETGTPIVVRKIEESKAPEMGRWTDVYGEILEGGQKGKLVQLSEISTRKPNGSTNLDPSMLEPADRPPK